MTAVGVDACPGGWVGVVLAADGSTQAVWGETLDALAAHVPDAAGFGIDIPIGLPSDAPRPADAAARGYLGPRRSSVFSTPVREALLAGTHAEASAVSRQRIGQGLSQQAYALRAKILDADGWVAGARVPVWEVHPEVSFAELLGHPARASKKTWAGQRERLGALAAAGVALGELPGAGPAAPDDVLDAAAAAWSTRRLLRGEGMSLPPDPPVDAETGRPIAIWA